MLKIRSILPLLLVCALALTSCIEAPDKEAQKWEAFEKGSKQSEVNLVYYSDLDFETWLKDAVSPALMNRKQIKLTVEKSKLASVLPSEEELQVKSSEGRYDILLIRADEYEALSKKGVLYPNFVTELPNYRKYIAHKDYSNSYIGSKAIGSDALCFYQRQLHFFYNSDLMFAPPKDLDELLEYAEENPGALVIPHPETEEGKLFLQAIILSFTDATEFAEPDLSRQDVSKLAVPGLRYLKKLKPYLYAGGSMMPKDSAELDDLFLDEETHISLSLNTVHAEEKLKELEYPDYTKSFQPLPVSVTSPDYLAVIPVNADNKSGAMVVLNEILSTEQQRSMYLDPKLGGAIVYSKANLDKGLSAVLDEEVKKKSIEKPSSLIKRKVGKIPEPYWQMILDEWRKMR